MPNPLPYVATPRCLSDLSAPQLAQIVCSKGAAFQGYSKAIISNSFGGDVIDMLDINDVTQLMESMGISTPHKLVLKATFASWKKNPEAAFEALAMAEDAAAKKALEEAAAAREKAAAAAAKKMQEQEAAFRRQAAEAVASEEAWAQAAAALAAAQAAAYKKAAAAPVSSRLKIVSLGRYSAPSKHVRSNGYIYATAHVHDVDARAIINDGTYPVYFDAGFEVAPGDASDIAVANSHTWGSQCLVFSDGGLADTALRIAQAPFNKGKKFGHHNLLRNGAKALSAPFNVYDILLRMLDYKPDV